MSRHPRQRKRRFVSSRLVAAAALGCGCATGCFAIFPLDAYGPGAGDGGEPAETSVTNPDAARPDATGEASTAEGGSIAFVTSERIAGRGINGLEGADSRCAAIARDAALDGSFKAILGDRGTDLKSRLRSDAGRIVTRNGVVLADSLDDLLANGPRAPFVEDERGTAVQTGGTCTDGRAAWTGALPDGGASSSDCTRWDGFTPNDGTAGTIGATSSGQWLSACARPCENTASLYCLQQ